MNILVVSDSHGKSEELQNVICSQDWDYIFYLGDGISDLGNLVYLENIYIVKGNCDIFSNYPNSRVIDINGFRFFITHGHIYSAKSGLGGLIAYNKDINANVVLYGHTHKSANDIVDGVYYVNPGAITTNRGGSGEYAVIWTDNKNIKISHFSL